MHRSLIDYLRCPLTEKPLNIYGIKVRGSFIEEGILYTDEGNWYPIIDYIPRLLSGDFRQFNQKRFKDTLDELPVSVTDTSVSAADTGQRQVQDSFSDKWLKANDWGHEGASRKFFFDWFLKKYGWKSKARLADYLSETEVIFDAGCGTGRDLRLLTELTDSTLKIGVDLSRAIEVAGERMLPAEDVLLVQADVMQLPFKPTLFDFIHSEGVLHHTPDTRRAFEAVSKQISENGQFEFYIYRKKAPTREFVDTKIRRQTSSLPFEECWEFSRKITNLGRKLHETGGEFEIEEMIPYFDFPAEETTIQRFIYNHLFKCFWNDQMSFEENCAVNFDWYSPYYAHRHTEEEIRSWIEELNLKIQHWHEEYSGFSVRVSKADT